MPKIRVIDKLTGNTIILTEVKFNVDTTDVLDEYQQDYPLDEGYEITLEDMK